MFNFLRDIIIIFLTFIVNFLIISTFWTLWQLFSPIGWPWLYEGMDYAGIAFIPVNITIVLSSLTLISPCLLYRTWFMQRYLCWAANCRKPKKAEAVRLDQAMSMVCSRAQEDPGDYNIYVCNMKALNAFAIGKNNIAVTLPLLNGMYVEEIAGILAHEMGHIKHSDTNIALITSVMGSFGNLVIRIYNILVLIMQFLGFIPILGWFFFILSWIFLIQIWVFQFLMQLPLYLLTMFGSRQDEYEADLYACRIGLGVQLYHGLTLISQGDTRKNFLTRLLSSHPDTEKRLERIRKYITTQK